MLESKSKVNYDLTFERRDPLMPNLWAYPSVYYIQKKSASYVRIPTNKHEILDNLY